MRKIKTKIKQAVEVPPALSVRDMATVLGVHWMIIHRNLQRLAIQPIRMCGIARMYSPEVVDVLRRALSERSTIYKALVKVGAQPAAT
jgi:hypothetical protein